MKKSVVNVVVTCTKDKKHPVADDCQLRNVSEVSLQGRMKEWQSRLNRRWRERVPVEDLYSGDHWATVKSFNSSFFAIDIWVCSAGVGLVRLDDEITPYAATFSNKHADSVSGRLNDIEVANAVQTWWTQLTKWKSRSQDRPRSLTNLMAAYPSRSIMVVASENYLRAISDDLRSGVRQLNDPDLLSIVGAGTPKLAGLDQNLVPCDARFQAVTGGARRSLNTRLARKILNDSRVPPKCSSLTRKYRKLLEEQPEIARYDRQPMTDQQVRKFIHQQLLADCSLTHTRLLRRLREQDNACEQKRFASLYRDVRLQVDGE